MSEKLKFVSKLITYTVAGGVCLWAPDVALKAYRGYTDSRWDLPLVSLLMPTAILIGYAVLYRLQTKDVIAPSLAFYMLIGLWLFGSSAMMIGASFSGGGFSSPGFEVWAVIALGLLPPYTFIMLCYDGSLLGFMFGAMAMMMMHLTFERRRWVLPSKITRWFQQSAT